MDKRIYEGKIKVYDKETIIVDDSGNDVVSIGDGYIYQMFQDIDKGTKIRVTIEEIKSEEKETTIPITYGFIKETCGWGKFAETCGYNEWAVNERGIEDNEIFQVKKSDAEKLRLI